MRQESTSYRQMELNDRRSEEERLSPEQMRAQMENARRQAEFYEAQRVQWEAQQQALEESKEQKALFNDSLNDIGMRIHNAVKRMEKELESMDREQREVTRICECLQRHLQILSSLQPHTWPPAEFAAHLHEALPKLERAENDFHEAYYGASHYRHTDIFLHKPGEEERARFNLKTIGEHMAKGFAFHLPLFVLLLLTWLAYTLYNLF